MNIVNDIDYISTLINTLRTDSNTNTKWTYTFDFKVIINAASW